MGEGEKLGYSGGRPASDFISVPQYVIFSGLHLNGTLNIRQIHFYYIYVRSLHL